MTNVIISTVNQILMVLNKAPKYVSELKINPRLKCQIRLNCESSLGPKANVDHHH